ncbi:MAG: alpha/beta hydrolase, partial [Acidobacteriaceae bacterium]
MKHAQIATNDIAVHAVELGSGPAVIFCHGFPDTWRGWRRQMEVVADAGYRAIALDMRGYGGSSAPENPEAYTVLHTVGDVVGLMDALAVKQAVIVGHDFGASVAWSAAMMRPDRFPAVFGLSVPFSPRGEKSFLQAMIEAGYPDFYMFSRMLPTAEAAWSNPRERLPANLYWSSAAAPKSERGTLFNRDEPKYRRLSAPLPSWANKEDLESAIADFERTGFRGPLNYCRSIQPGFNLTTAFTGRVVEQPSFFLAGEEDGGKDVGGGFSEERLRKALPGLVGWKLLPGVGHWPQLEAADATNTALVGFLH